MNQIELALEYLGQFLVSPWMVAAGFLVGIGGIALTIRASRSKKPVCLLKSRTLITDYTSAIDKLKVFYNEQQVSDLTVTKMAFWNAGKETIRRADLLPEHDPLRILPQNESLILDASIIATNCIANNMALRVAGDHMSVTLDFEFLDHNQGGIIQVIHTGSRSTRMHVVGTIMGSKGPKRAAGRAEIAPGFAPMQELRDFIQRHSNVVPSRGRRVLLAVAMFAMPFVPLFAEFSTEEAKRMGPAQLAAFFTFIAVPYWYMAYSVARRLVPKGLESIEE